jgi:hypothetical protein
MPQWHSMPLMGNDVRSHAERGNEGQAASYDGESPSHLGFLAVLSKTAVVL